MLHKEKEKQEAREERLYKPRDLGLNNIREDKHRKRWLQPPKSHDSLPLSFLYFTMEKVRFFFFKLGFSLQLSKHMDFGFDFLKKKQRESVICFGFYNVWPY